MLNIYAIIACFIAKNMHDMQYVCQALNNHDLTVLSLFRKFMVATTPGKNMRPSLLHKEIALFQ